jgi:hypothetical protein
MQLQQHDGIEQPPALRISIRTKPRFSAQLEALFTAAGEDKGLSQLQISNPVVSETTLTAAISDEQDGSETQTQLLQTEPEPFTNEANIPAQLSQQVVDEDLSHDDAEPDNHDIYRESNEEVYEGNYDLEEYPEEGDGEVEEIEENIAYPGEESLPHETETYEDESAEYEEPTYDEAGPSVLDGVSQNYLRDELVGAPEEDIESSGSSTVQGENDAPHNCQYFCAFTPDHWLTQYKDSKLDDSAEKLASTFENIDQENIEHPGDHFTTHDEDENATTHPVSDELASNPPAEIEGESQSQNLEDSAYDLDTSNQEWGSVGYEDERHPEDQNLDDNQHEENGGEVASADRWDGFANQGNLGDDNDFNVVTHSTHSATGTFQVPDESAEEDEDSITYDDEPEEEVVEESAVTASQAHSSGSPLGKRSREEDHESGGEDGSDKGLFKLRFFKTLTNGEQIPSD